MLLIKKFQSGNSFDANNNNQKLNPKKSPKYDSNGNIIPDDNSMASSVLDKAKNINEGIQNVKPEDVSIGMKDQQAKTDNAAGNASAAAKSAMLGMAPAATTAGVEKVGADKIALAATTGGLLGGAMRKSLFGSMKTDQYGNPTNNMGGYLKEITSDPLTNTFKAISDGKGAANKIGGAFRELSGLGALSRGITSLAGKNNKKTGFFGALNKFDGQAAKMKTVDDAQALANKAADDENKKRETERNLNSGLAQDQFNSASLQAAQRVYKNGGIFKLQNGGETNMSDEITNNLLDNPYVVKKKII